MSASTPKVSVITCVHNGERFLAAAIESVLGQQFGDFEYWLVNDASTDRSREIIASYQSDPRVRALDTERNVGAYSAANLALAKARGEYVARMDADDLSLPHRLALQTQFLDNHPEVGLLGSAYAFIDEEDLSIDRHEAVPTRSEDIRWTLLFQNCIAHSTVMYRRRLAEALGFYADGWYSQDYDLWSRMSFVADVAQLPTVCVHYRVVDTGLTAHGFDVQQEVSHEVSRHTLARLLGRAADDPGVAEFVRWHSQMGKCSAGEVEQAHRFILSLAEPFCRRFGYTGRDRDRIMELARERIFWIVRWKEAEAPGWALAVYLRLIAANLQRRGYRRLLPAIGKWIIGPKGIQRARELRARTGEARRSRHVARI